MRRRLYETVPYFCMTDSRLTITSDMLLVYLHLAVQHQTDKIISNNRRANSNFIFNGSSESSFLWPLLAGFKSEVSTEKLICKSIEFSNSIIAKSV